MDAYRYIKTQPVTITVPVFPVLSVSVGLALLLFVLGPIISFAFFYAPAPTLVTPLAPEVQAAEILTSDDLSKASNWFPNQKTKKTVTPVDAYFISIPKLKINQALVKIGSDDLSANLIHYGGTGVPGKEGNAVIFGHSTLPALYNPENYLTIFSRVPTLKVGDAILVNFDGVEYKYEVIGKRITQASDVSGLEQRFDDSYLTLVTCVPPGTYWERLWVSAKLVPFASVTP